MTGAKLNKIYTKFVFFKASPDGSIVRVVLSLPAGTASPWAGYGQGPVGPSAKLDKTRPKPDAFKKVLVGKAAGKGVFGLLCRIPLQQSR